MLRQQVLRGSAYLVFRQGFGMGVRLGGVLLLTRLIGPTSYGLYTAAFGVMLYFSQVARMGTDVYLVRRPGHTDEAVYHQVFSFLLVSSVAVAGLGLLSSPLIGWWLHDRRFVAPLEALLLMLPLTTIYAPAVARLERALDYRRVAFLELAEQILYYATALALAWKGFGVWAPIVGFGISQVWLIIGSYALARYRPHWFWSRDLAGEMFRYGMGFSASGWVWQLRAVASLVIVGRYLGPAGVGYITLALGLIDGLSFVKSATWRLSIAVLSKLQDDRPRLRQALEEATALQVLVLAPLLAAFALVGPWLLPLLFGHQWLPTLTVYPFIALGVLVNAAFSIHASVLFVLKRNVDVAIFNFVNVALLVSAALVLVPRFGLVGWGLAEVVALASYPIIHWQVSRLFPIDYTRALPWFVAFTPTLFTSLIGWPVGLALWLCPLVIPFSWTARTQMKEYWTQLRRQPT